VAAANPLATTLEDTYGASANPTTNYGSGGTVQINDAPLPAKDGYFKFTVPAGYQNPGQRVIFSFTALGNTYVGSPAMADVQCLTGTTWAENTLTWNGRPIRTPGNSCGAGRAAVGAATGRNSVPLTLNITTSTLTLHLIASDDSGDPARFDVYSSEAATATNRPTLEFLPAPGATPIPTPMPTATPTPTPTLTPTPAPTLAPSACLPVGFGAGATGGAGGTTINVATGSALRSALEQSGTRTVVMTANGTYDTVGKVQIGDGNLTLRRAAGTTGIIKGGLLIKGPVSNVVIEEVPIRPTDLSGDADDLDALTLNGLTGAVNNVRVSRATLIWGPDVGGLAMLGDVNNVTVQCSIMGEGLYVSEHFEATAASGGHSKGMSIFQLNAGTDPADNITLYGNLYTRSDDRMPIIQGARTTDFINNAVYNWGKNGATGNPRGMNYVGNLFKKGPLTPGNVLYVWKSRQHSANPCCYANSVYPLDNLAVGFAYSDQFSSGVKRTTPNHAFSVTPMAASAVTAFIRANVGPTTRDAQDTRIVNDFANGTGSQFYNGQDHPAPNPSWP